MNYLLTSVTLPNGTQSDVLIRDGVIQELGSSLKDSSTTVIDSAGLQALPGLVDLHTHLREPGFEHSETVLTGSRAAASGGFTAVFAMANTMPVQDTAGTVEQVASLGEEFGYATVRPIGAVTAGLAGTALAEIGAMAQSRARVRVFSDDGKCVSDSLLMRRALEYVSTFGGVIAQHAQDPRLTDGAQMNEGELSSKLGLAGWPAVAEESIIARDVLLAEHVGARLHVCHISTAGSVDVIRWAKARGIRVTAEATPHHLLLDEQRVVGYDARFKVNPPLRRAEDVLALRAAVADGTIDIVATDHAPHPLEAKECAWDEAAFGMVGLESALSVVQTSLMDTGLIGFEDVARLLSVTPAAIGGLAGYESPLAVGAPANITLYDPSARSVFDVTRLHGKSVNSPYLGIELPGRVVHTFHDGYATVLDGVLVDTETVARNARIALAFLAVALLLVALGWRNRRKRQSYLPALEPVPAELGAAILTGAGLYVATTLTGQRLERVTVGGLGFRSRVVIGVYSSGVVLAIPGQDDLFIPEAAIADVSRSTWTIDRVVEDGGLVCLGWTLGDTAVESFFRVEDSDSLLAALGTFGPFSSLPSDNDTVLPTTKRAEQP
jgi:dihydroorotase